MIRLAHNGAATRSRKSCKLVILDHAQQLALQNLENQCQIMTTLEDLPIHPDYRIHPLTIAQGRVFFDPVERVFGSAAKDRKHGRIAQAGNSVIAPLTRSDHAPIKRQDHAQLTPVEADALFHATK